MLAVNFCTYNCRWRKMVLTKSSTELHHWCFINSPSVSLICFPEGPTNAVKKVVPLSQNYCSTNKDNLWHSRQTTQRMIQLKNLVRSAKALSKSSWWHLIWIITCKVCSWLEFLTLKTPLQRYTSMPYFLSQRISSIHIRTFKK